MKSAGEQLDIVNAYAELGSYRAVATLCGTTHKTVRRIIERHRAGTFGQRSRPPRRPRNTDHVADLIARRMKATDGRTWPSGCCRRHGRPAMPARPGASAARSRPFEPTGADTGASTDLGLLRSVSIS